jgi:hypothetical protein
MILFRTLSFIVALGVAAGSTDFLRGLKKPGGETLLVETICDAYDGKAFGLCKAYVAQDCETQPEQKSCISLYDMFVEATGEEPPYRVPCPCIATEKYYLAWVSAIQSMKKKARSIFLILLFCSRSLYAERRGGRYK